MSSIPTSRTYNIRNPGLAIGVDGTALRFTWAISQGPLIAFLSERALTRIYGHTKITTATTEMNITIDNVPTKIWSIRAVHVTAQGQMP